MSMFEQKSHEEIIECGKDLRDFAMGHVPAKPAMAKDMTLRDYFAAQMLQHIPTNFDLADKNAYVWRCYEMADAMMKERAGEN